MSKKLINMTNHRLMPAQVADAEALGYTEIVELPPALKEAWGKVPPDFDAVGVAIYCNQFAVFIEAEGSPSELVILLAGDYGATAAMLRWADSEGYVCLQSTMNRIAEDVVQPDGSVKTTHIISHNRFRKL